MNGFFWNYISSHHWQVGKLSISVCPPIYLTEFSLVLRVLQLILLAFWIECQIIFYQRQFHPVLYTHFFSLWIMEARTSGIMLDGTLVCSSLSENCSHVSSWNIILALGFWLINFIRLKMFPSVPNLLSVFFLYSTVMNFDIYEIVKRFFLLLHWFTWLGFLVLNHSWILM